MSTVWVFGNIGNKHNLCRAEDCMKKFISLTEHATNVINFEKKNMLPLTKEELKSHQDAKACYICQKRFLKRFANDKIYRKVRDHCHFIGKYRGAAHSICSLRFNVPNDDDDVSERCMPQTLVFMRFSRVHCFYLCFHYWEHFKVSTCLELSCL